VVRQIDGASPQPPQRFTPEQFVAWAKKQTRLADEVHCCYEAGPFGFVLHKRLVQLGIKNVVVRPRNWDEYGKKVKTDRRDALALVSCLDRYLAGNTAALNVLRVPADAEEHDRSQSRQRAQLHAERKRLAAQGLSAARYYGHDLPTEWWREKLFALVRRALPDFLVELLARRQRLLLAIDTEFSALSQHIEAAQATELPTGLGALTAQILDREIGDWTRFENRRQAASYSGLVPGEDCSGARRFQGAITRHGNRRVRHILVEAAWRLQRFQPEYHAVKRHRAAFDEARARGAKALRKKLNVALARQFLVDWWRVRTGRTTAAALGLQMSWPSAAILRDKTAAKPPAA